MSLIAVVLVSSTAIAQDSNSSDQLRAALDSARYDEVVAVGQAVLARRNASTAERVAALEAIAIAHVANRDDAAAERRLRELYRLDPGHRLTDADASPVVHAAFARARDQQGESAPVEVSPTLRREPGALFVEADLEDPDRAVDRVVVAFRHRPSDEFSRLTLRRVGGRAEATAPIVAGSDSRRVEYFVEARALSGAVLASAGDAAHPRSATVPLPRDTSPVSMASSPMVEQADDSTLLESPWFWTAAVALVGGAVTGYVLLGPPSEGPDPGTLGQGALR